MFYYRIFFERNFLEQIFNEFAEKQDSESKENINTELSHDDSKNTIIKDENIRKSIRFQKIVLTDELVNLILE